jgi:hypothetical protein
MQNQNQDISNITVPNYIRYLDYVADKLFISSFILNKIKDFPLNQFSIIASNIALLCMGLAFTLQIFTTRYYHTKPNADTFNYTLRSHVFAHIGSIGAWLCIFFPNLWLISLWIFCFNNLLWTYNELSRLSNPSIYPSMPNDQKQFCKYVACIALATLVSAIGNTLGLFFIDHKSMILYSGMLLNWMISALGINYLFKATTPPTEAQFNQSQLAYSS